MDSEALLQLWLHHFNYATLFTSIIISLLVFKLLHSLKPQAANILNLPPSPPKLPIIGNFHQVGKDLHRALHTLSHKYGPVMLLRFGSIPFLVVSSPEVAREIICINDVFANRPQTKVGDSLFFKCTDIAFAPLGDYWRQAKKICVLELLSQRRVQALRFVREEEVMKMVEKIKGFCQKREVVDLTEMLQTTSNAIVARSALGKVYERKNSDNLSLGELSRRAMDLIGAFCFGDLFPLLGWIDVLTGLTGKLRRVSKDLHAFLDWVIEEHRGQNRNNDEKTEKTDIVDILLHLQEDGMLEPKLSRENLKALLLDMFIGGTDTTAVTMEWAMAELVKNPSIMKKAQEEVRRVVGKKLEVDETDINQMEYLKCIAKETTRLHAPTMITRHTNVGTKLQGYDIPPKTSVFVNSWAIQRDPKLWERPEEFVPERFMNDSMDFAGQNSRFMPFGGGKRGCPGMLFAIAETEYVLANLLHWFDWELPDGLSVEEFDMSDAFAVVIHKRLPLLLVPKVYSF